MVLFTNLHLYLGLYVAILTNVMYYFYYKFVEGVIKV